MNWPDADAIRYLDRGDLINLNDSVTGDVMIRDLHLLDSAVARPRLCLFGQPQFPTLADKAAALLHSLAYHHLFVDGNKRTAILAVRLFAARNGLRFVYDAADPADFTFVLEIAQGRHDPEAIAAWLSDRLVPGP
ncbi:MAG: type II toxin-antitoxin system death-on-curing family toxin [Candidatus Flexifilum sp.]|jgi:death-on-curing protein